MGDRPGPEFSIERVNTFGNYEPANCVWATVSEQVANKRTTRWIEWRGERRKLFEVCREVGLGVSVVAGRLKMGWDVERALSSPVR